MKIIYLAFKFKLNDRNPEKIRRYLFLKNLVENSPPEINIDYLFIEKLFWNNLLFKILNRYIIRKHLFVTIWFTKVILKRFILKKDNLLENYDQIIFSGQNPHLFLILFKSISNKIISLSENSFITIKRDKGNLNLNSIKDRYLYFFEKEIFEQFKITFCSQAYISFIKKLYNIKGSNFIQRPLGSPFEYYNLLNFFEIQSPDSFLIKKIKGFKRNGFKLVLFYAHFHKMHGLEIILEAFRLLCKIDKKFKLILIGKTDPNNPKSYNNKLDKFLKLNQKFDNIFYYPNIIPLDEIFRLFSYFDLGLGIFGKSVRSHINIPIKIYDMTFMGLPFITKESPALNEYFPKSIRKLFIRFPSGSNLAEKILFFFNLTEKERKKFHLKLKKIYVEEFSFKKQVSLILK